MNHDNIYNILDKLNALAPKQLEQPQVKTPIYESVEAKGSVTEGVAAVEARLSQQFNEAGIGERVLNKYAIGMAAAKKQAGYGSKPAHNLPKSVITKGHEIAKGIKEEDDECPTCGESPCKCDEEVNEGFDDLQKYMASKEKSAKQGGGEGKKQGTRYGGSQQKDDEGDAEVSDEPKKKGRPKKDKFAESESLSDRMTRIERRLSESVNFSEMIKETGQSLEEMVAELNQDMDMFKKTGHCSDKLEAFLKVHSYGKKKLADESTMNSPAVGSIVYHRGQAGKVDRVQGDKCFVHKANGEMDVWPVSQCDTKKQSMLDVAKSDASDIWRGAKAFMTGQPEQMEEDKDLNELARLAGLNVAESTGKKPDDDKDGIPNWADKNPNKAGGDEDRKDEEIEQEGNAFGKAVRDAKSDGIQPGEKVKVGGKEYPVKENMDMEECGEMPGMSAESGMNVTTTMDTKTGRNSITVTADGESAKQLAQMLALAGMGGKHVAQDIEPDVKVIDMASGEEMEEAVDEPSEEPVNGPDEHYYNMRQSTLNPGEGDNGEKNMYGGDGDNKMTQRTERPSIPVRNVKEADLSLEARLAAEYESIKKVG